MASRVFFVVVFVCMVTIVTSSEDRQPLDCPANEEYSECSLAVCYKNCAHLKTPPACPGLAPGCYVPACVCKDGMLRNDAGVCVPIDKCD